MKSGAVTVVELGCSKVSALIAEMDNNHKLKVLAYARVDCSAVQQGRILDGDEVAVCIGTALNMLQPGGKLPDGTELILNVAGPTLESTNSQGLHPIFPEGRAITREDVHQVLNHSRKISFPPGREVIHALPRSFMVDGESRIINPVGRPGHKLEVSTHIVTVASDHLAMIEDCVKKAGYRVGLFVAQPLAAGLGVLMLDDSKNGCLTVDLGAGTTDIEIFLDQAPAFTMSIPVGTHLITSDVHHLLRTSLDEAERLKLAYAEAHSQAIPPEDSVEVKQNGFDQARPMQRKVLCEIVESRVREIARFVREAVDESGLRDSIRSGVVLTGGGAQMPRIDEAFANVLELEPVRVGSPAGLSSRTGECHSPAWATAVGMARFALGQIDELTPVTGGLGWKDRIRTLWSMFGGGKH